MTGHAPLADRTALVTASSRNLGAVVAEALADAGARVAVTYHRSRDAAEDVVAALRERTGADHVAVGGDLSEPAGAVALVDAALDALDGHVDVLVNNAGPFSMTPFAELPVAEWAFVWDSNVTAAYLATQRVVPGMRERGWGRIVNVSAGSAYLRNHAAYGLAKDALGTLTESLALELGPEVTVNAVAPGQIAESAPDVSAIDPTFVDRAVERTPAGRLVTRREVADVVVALCTPAFDLVTGAVLPLDGGWRLNRF